MKATISVIHRISDGAEAVKFMQAITGFLENPVMMLVWKSKLLQSMWLRKFLLKQNLTDHLTLASCIALFHMAYPLALTWL